MPVRPRQLQFTHLRRQLPGAVLPLAISACIIFELDFSRETTIFIYKERRVWLRETKGEPCMELCRNSIKRTYVMKIVNMTKMPETTYLKHMEGQLRGPMQATT